jgi:outer membrane immunogenic protein
MRWSWAVGARLGWVVTPSLLTYVSGGFTQAQFDGVNYHTGADNALTITNSAVAFGVETAGDPLFQVGSRTKDGWFIGGGTEYAVGWLPGLFWKNEYRYADYGNTTQNVICTICTAVAGGPLGLTGLAERTKTTVQTFRTELVWRFNWAGPSVVAKY